MLEFDLASLTLPPMARFAIVAFLLRRVVQDASLGGGFEHAGEQAGVERLYGIRPMPRLRSAGISSISTVRTARLYRLCSEVRPRKWRADAADWARATSQAAKLLLPT